jgi:hypothetical protein
MTTFGRPLSKDRDANHAPEDLPEAPRADAPTRALPRWPLFLIALPAAVAVWSGWVGLAALCGFGIVHPLPGLLDGFTINTSITLPIGVECYAAYAMGAWLTPGAPETARKFARRSAVGSLALGVLGQVAYHLLSAAHATRAPWPVVVLVSSLPVIVLGFGAALSHLLRSESGALLETTPTAVPEVHPEPAPVTHPESAPSALTDALPGTQPRAARTAARVRPKPNGRAKQADPVKLYAANLEVGTVPSLRRIKSEMHVGQDKAKAIHAELMEALKRRTRSGVTSGAPASLESTHPRRGHPPPEVSHVRSWQVPARTLLGRYRTVTRGPCTWVYLGQAELPGLS